MSNRINRDPRKGRPSLFKNSSLTINESLVNELRAEDSQEASCNRGNLVITISDRAIDFRRWEKPFCGCRTKAKAFEIALAASGSPGYMFLLGSPLQEPMGPASSLRAYDDIERSSLIASADHNALSRCRFLWIRQRNIAARQKPVQTTSLLDCRAY